MTTDALVNSVSLAQLHATLFHKHKGERGNFRSEQAQWTAALKASEDRWGPGVKECVTVVVDLLKSQDQKRLALQKDYDSLVEECNRLRWLAPERTDQASVNT